jgi:plasmid maintenance system antidote protein VapI
METTRRYRATRLEEIIREQGRERQWVAAQAGVHYSLITHLLRGRRTVSEPVAQRIASALGVPLFLAFELSGDSKSLGNGKAA